MLNVKLCYRIVSYVTQNPRGSCKLRNPRRSANKGVKHLTVQTVFWVAWPNNLDKNQTDKRVNEHNFNSIQKLLSSRPDHSIINY